MPNSKWVVSEKVTSYSFVKSGSEDDEEDEENEESDPTLETLCFNDEEDLRTFARCRSATKFIAKNSTCWGYYPDNMVSNYFHNLQFKPFKDQKRVDFVANGVWAIKFFSPEEYESFIRKCQEYLFENTYGYEANDANKVKVYGKDFLGWAKLEEVDDSMWEDAEESLHKTPTKTPIKESHDLNEEFEEAATNGGAIQSLVF
ncbi:CYPRO4 [Olea europaea subsp. europaea]|uniref:CYPRO4 n=1 Tax=Olea europaea subsp. europaea TaxID=158383 RepID=A0A8S0UD41_OLEEU|nr:CYPRO4 [Olea europaea subsp. europaea]